MNITPWELERANAAIEDAMREAVRQAMYIPRHIIIEGYKRDIEQLGYTAAFLALSQPRHGTNDKPGVPRHGGNRWK